MSFPSSKSFLLKIGVVAGVALFLALPAIAQMTGHHGHTHHANLSAPKEPGQGAFAAIAEIVALLQNDPATDWSKVDISSLREHLVDMEKLTIEAQAETAVTDSAVIFTITGDGGTLRAIQTMVPAHAGVLTSTGILEATGEATETGATLTVGYKTEAEKQKLIALGFFGVMATGAHHQEHHLAMARGESVHRH